MVVKNSKKHHLQPFATILLKCISLIILIFTGTENFYGKTTSIKRFGIDLVAESLPNSLCYHSIKDIKQGTIFFYLIFSKNLRLRYKENILEIKLLSREIGYRASYNYKIKENEIDSCHILVDSFNLQNLKLTHDHVYDFLSISYGKEYKFKVSFINLYRRVNIGFAINFPGEFYYKYLRIHPINLKEIRYLLFIFDYMDDLRMFDIVKYNRAFEVWNWDTDNIIIRKSFYKTVFNSTSSYQWTVNILIGLIENIFIEYAIVVPFCALIAICPLYIHISIGTILGTIEWLYKKIKNNDKRGFLKEFYSLFLLKSIFVFKIGYYE